MENLSKEGFVLKLQLQDWTLETRPEKTAAFYAETANPVCECLYCRNYRLACRSLPPSVKEFFARLGIDPLKGGEIFELGFSDDGLRRYGGFYHLVGRIVQGPQDCKTDWEKIRLVRIDNFSFGFSDDLELVPDGFPASVIQLEFEARLPWLLEEEPEEDE